MLLKLKVVQIKLRLLLVNTTTNEKNDLVQQRICLKYCLKLQFSTYVKHFLRNFNLNQLQHVVSVHQQSNVERVYNVVLAASYYNFRSRIL